jgi:two-component system chemotaxis response regulator CheY
MKVLLVDDSNSVAIVVTQMLKEAGFDCIRAKDGQDAVDILMQDNGFDIVLLDWNMPNMDGLEFLEHNEKNKIVPCPIVMMTTENKPEKIMKALEHGASEYIMKPFTQDILVTKINAVTTTAA